MKRFLSSLLCTLLLVSLAVPASASQLLPKFDKLVPEKKYADTDSNNTFSIPKGWSSSEIADDPVAKVQFTKDSDDSAVIQYGSVDLWALLSEEEQGSLSREDMDNSIYTAKEIAELLDAKEKNVKTAQVNDIEYFRAEIKTGFFSRVTDTYYIRIHQGWMYVYAFSAGSSHSEYETYLELITSSSYGFTEEPEPTATEPATEPEPTTPVVTEPSKDDLYAQAVKYYEQGEFGTANAYFADLDGYKDSDKYLRLLDIRWYGSNANIGTGYQAECGLTDHQKREIDKAASDFYFADTAEVLLCNTDVACYYLFGEWITAEGSRPYAYFKMKASASGGYFYTRSSNLSNATSKTVSINDGDVRISVTGPNTLVFHMDLIAPDCMSIYSYETCNSFLLYKQ